MECVFCTDASVRARTVSENELARAFLTNTPITVGHTLVIPKRHLANMSEMTTEERAALLDLAERIKRGLRSSFGVQGFNHAWNEGDLAGQSISHLHLHIVPRTQGDAGILEYEPRKFLYRPGSRAETSQEELASILDSLKTAMSKRTR